MTLSLACLKFKQGGGVERYLLDVINGLHQVDITPKFYSTSFNQTLPEYQWIESRKIDLSWCPKKLRLPFFSRAILKQKAYDEVVVSIQTVRGADILICGGQHRGYLCALNRKASLMEKFKINNEQKAYDECKLIVAHSQLMKDELIELYRIPKNKIIVLYPPANTQKFHTVSSEVRSDLRKKFGFSEQEIIYIFPSTGHYRKGFDLLKSYFEQTDLPIKLVVAGTPVVESKNIRSLGFCNNMPELYQAGDFTIMASKYEPFGLVGIESILCGTPIIFSENMACTEVFKNNFGYTFMRNDFHSLDTVLKTSVENRTRIEKPQDALNYDPTLEAHIQSLLNIINQLHQ
ncbi:glycosyltransferase involved in cell wall biosynthesis [Cricetibacter osteomyelitidis]|uniref:Glycosyltransferase involved in cell wall biosynthesis n=1 Tax=Cricetibacter osteomyelitidis TaxID=1521931 RepID=A0A4R2TJM7_9PAST|nr:glycosyltransferase family 4 protein [Cricetibacter osteomyelitidis]TCP95022.1 glycosyltransferase involved in cell wall biosynthesis [Cricetibacter osteomyelitidis]